MKEKILQKSLELFSQKGFDAVSVSMIGDGLGISKGALYKHYESKKAILDAIVKRMEEMDYELSGKFDIPEDIFENIPEAYRGSSMEQLFSFTFAMFVYWTENEFASRFRKLISIEQFNSPDMAKLYQKYLGSGPLKYVEEVFSEYKELLDTELSPGKLALDFYAPVYMLINLYDSAFDKRSISMMVKSHIESFLHRLLNISPVKYPRSKKYSSAEFMSLITGPNPFKLEEELLENHRIAPGAVVCDLGCGNGLTSVFLANEYNFKIYAADLWSDPEANSRFFESLGFGDDRIKTVKADAQSMPFDKEFFDAIVSVGSYNYFGRDPDFLDEKLLPYVKQGGYIYIAIPGMKKDCHDSLPEELLLSWNAEQMDFLHDKDYWRSIVEQSEGAQIISLKEMRSNKELWDDWLEQDNEYARSDRKSMEAGAGKYLNFIQIILRKK